MILNCNIDLKKACAMLPACCGGGDGKLIQTSKGLFTNAPMSQDGLNLQSLGIPVKGYQKQNATIAPFHTVILPESNISMVQTKSPNVWWGYTTGKYEHKTCINSKLKLSVQTLLKDERSITLSITYTVSKWDGQILVTEDDVVENAWEVTDPWDNGATWDYLNKQNRTNFEEFKLKKEEVTLPVDNGVVNSDWTVMLSNGEFTYQVLLHADFVFGASSSVSVSIKQANLVGSFFRLNMPHVPYDAENASLVTPLFIGNGDEVKGIVQFHIYGFEITKLHSINQIMMLSSYEKEQIFLFNQDYSMTAEVQIVNFNSPEKESSKGDDCGCGCDGNEHTINIPFVSLPGQPSVEEEDEDDFSDEDDFE